MMPMGGGGGGMGGLFAGGMPQLRKTGKAVSSETRSEASSSQKPGEILCVCVRVCVHMLLLQWNTIQCPAVVRCTIPPVCIT